MITKKEQVESRRINAMHIKVLCSMLVKIVNQDMERKLSESGINVNISALVPLRILQYGPVTIQELSELIIVAPATLIPVVDELEKRGLITRETKTNDRRKKLISTTAKGTKLISRVMELNKASSFVTSISLMPKQDTEKCIEYLEEIVNDVSGSDAISKRIGSNICRQLSPGHDHTHQNHNCKLGTKNSDISNKSKKSK